MTSFNIKLLISYLMILTLNFAVFEINLAFLFMIIFALPGTPRLTQGSSSRGVPPWETSSTGRLKGGTKDPGLGG